MYNESNVKNYWDFNLQIFYAWKNTESPNRLKKDDSNVTF